MILCCGESLIDMIPVDSFEGRAFKPMAGGSILNTAVALGRLGARVGMVSGLSNDLFGQMLLDELSESHVDTSMLARSPRPSTLAFVEISNEGHASYTFYDENTAGRMLLVDDIPEFPDKVSTLYLGGISLCCEPGAEAYLALAERESGRRIIVLDPNIRPHFIRDELNYRTRLEQLLNLADIVKVSDDDLHWIMQGRANIAAKFAEFAPSCTLKLLTRGGDGATAMLRQTESINVPAKRVEVADTVGAGDTFNAGVMMALQEMGRLKRQSFADISVEEVKRALRFGTEVAAFTVQRKGCVAPWRHDL